MKKKKAKLGWKLLLSSIIIAIPTLVLTISFIATVVIWYYITEYDVGMLDDVSPYEYGQYLDADGNVVYDTAFDPSLLVDASGPKAIGPEANQMLVDMCKKFNVRYSLALAVMGHESSYNSNAVGLNKNEAGQVTSRDKGLFQINDRYESWYAEMAGLETWDVFNPIDNIQMGVAGLNHFYSYWSNKGFSGRDLDLRGLNSYNMGIAGYTEYMDEHKSNISRYYDRDILKRESDILGSVSGNYLTDAVIAGIRVPWSSKTRISSDYGLRLLSWETKARIHHGVDITYGTGKELSPIYPIANGVVVRVLKYDDEPKYRSWIPSYPNERREIGGVKVDSKAFSGSGQNVLILHKINGKNYYTCYAHMYRIFVKVGQQVNPNVMLGYEGNTGNSSSRHVHFEVRPSDQSGTINPWRFFGFNIQDRVANDKTIGDLGMLAKQYPYIGVKGKSLSDVYKR